MINKKNCEIILPSKTTCGDDIILNEPIYNSNTIAEYNAADQLEVWKNGKINNNSEKAKFITGGHGKYYGDTKGFCKSLIVPINVTINFTTDFIDKGNCYFELKNDAKIKPITHLLEVNKYLKENFINIFNDIYKETDFVFIGLPSAFQLRDAQASGGASLNKLSNHAYGAAVDIANKYANGYWEGAMNGKQNNRIYLVDDNHPVVKIFKKHGFGWGNYYNDYMHFSYLDGH
jgi:hypothetical protein